MLEKLYMGLQGRLADAVRAERSNLHYAARSSKLRARSRLLRGAFYDALEERLGSGGFSLEKDGGVQHCWSFLAKAVHTDSARASSLSFMIGKRVYANWDGAARERLQEIIREMNK